MPYVYMQIIIKSNLSSSIILSKKHIVYFIKYNWRKKDENIIEYETCTVVSEVREKKYHVF